MQIDRSGYIDEISRYIDKNVIKVLTGIRRCGKSRLLEMTRKLILSRGIPQKQIIAANFESKADPSVQSVDAMFERVRRTSESCHGEKLYLFFDEVQELDGWEKLVNSLDVDYSVDLYLTGSNANLLSSELSTYLAGRYVEIHVYPFSFAEVWPSLSREGFDERAGFREYIRRGGMPFIYDAGISGEVANAYLEDLFNSIVLKDIAHRHKVRDIDLLGRMLSYFLSEIAHAFSPASLVRYLKRDRRSCGLETIYNYAEFAEEACFIRRLKRYDLKGKELLSTQEKIYLTDHGFREALLGGNERHVDRILENIVAMELIRRGWRVEVGKLQEQEIDFVATRGSERQYVQVTYLMADEATRERVFRPLKGVTGDNYPRLVLSLDEIDFSDSGIRHQSIIDWCLER